MNRRARRLRRNRSFLDAIALLMVLAAPATADPSEVRIQPSNIGLGDRFGSGTAIAGQHAVVGAQAANGGGGDSGAVFVFDLATGVELRQILGDAPQAGAFLGCAVAAHGDLIIAGALRHDDVYEDSGAAFVFDAADGSQIHRFVASDAEEDAWFGVGVDICQSYAMVGAYRATPHGSYSGAAYVYDLATGEELLALQAADGGAGDWYGRAVAVSEQYAVVGAPCWDGIQYVNSGCGAVYVYDVATGELLHRLTTVDQGMDDRFGFALDIEGNHLAVGAYWDDNVGGSDAGAVYVFDLQSGEQLAELIAQPNEGAGDNLGSSVALNGNFVLAGATQQTYGTELEGFACLFDWTSGEEVLRLEASDGALGDAFGVSAAFDGEAALVGADRDDTGGINAGSAYIYQSLDIATGAPGTAAVLPGLLSLRSHPNPFNPRTEISLDLPVGTEVSLSIHDTSGRLVRRLLTNRSVPSGTLRTTWDGNDATGRRVPSGTYLCSAEAGGLRAVGKLTLTK